MSNLKISNVLNEVFNERLRQRDKWGDQNHPCLDLVLLNRSGGSSPQRMCSEYEIPSESRAKYLLEAADEKGALTFAHILIEEVSEAISEFDIDKRREELVQVAAVAVAWIEKIDRDKADKATYTILESYNEAPTQLDLVNEIAKQMEVVEPTDANGTLLEDRGIKSIILDK